MKGADDMADVTDVAAYILEECGSLSTMKLQKLAFYSQAYHLVRTGSELFPEDFQAWANGPVSPALFSRHRKRFVISRGAFGERNAPSRDEAASIDHVLSRLGEYNGSQLSDMSHKEAPWLNARAGCAPDARCSRVIPKSVMKAFYGSPSAASNPVFS